MIASRPGVADLVATAPQVPQPLVTSHNPSATIHQPQATTVPDPDQQSHSHKSLRTLSRVKGERADQ